MSILMETYTRSIYNVLKNVEDASRLGDCETLDSSLGHLNSLVENYNIIEKMSYKTDEYLEDYEENACSCLRSQEYGEERAYLDEEECGEDCDCDGDDCDCDGDEPECQCGRCK